MKLVDVYHNPALGKSNYYLASLRHGERWPEAGSAEVDASRQMPILAVPDLSENSRKIRARM